MSTNAVYDYQVGGYALPVGASICMTCRKPATVRVTVNRIERHGQLVHDSSSDYCEEHVGEATNAARLVCQTRLYGTNGTQDKKAS